MLNDNQNYIQGRGAQVNTHNRFQKTSKVLEHIEGLDEAEEPDAKTKFIEIFPKTIVNKVTSPEIGLSYSLNPYQGCEHGCTYCYARPTHEYWGYSAGIDFEKVILVKKNAAQLLEQTFQHKKWEAKTIMLSGNTDCYQPCERTFGITRRLLEVCLKYKHPVSIITKNVLINRDLDVLTELAKLNLVNVNLSFTTLNEELRRVLEPRTATAKKKLETIERLTANNIPVNIMIAPVIPALNDYEVFSIIKEVSKRGALSVHYQVVRLNGPNQQIFTDWLTKNFPDRASKVLNQLREIHGEQLNESRFGTRMKGEGNFALNLKRQFEIARKRFFADSPFPRLRKDLFERPNRNGQIRLELF
jgi:DNA repair photolyase